MGTFSLNPAGLYTHVTSSRCYVESHHEDFLLISILVTLQKSSAHSDWRISAYLHSISIRKSNKAPIISECLALSQKKKKKRKRQKNIALERDDPEKPYCVVYNFQLFIQLSHSSS